MKLTLILLFVGQSLQSSAICKCPRGSSGTQVFEAVLFWSSRFNNNQSNFRFVEKMEPLTGTVVWQTVAASMFFAKELVLVPNPENLKWRKTQQPQPRRLRMMVSKTILYTSIIRKYKLHLLNYLGIEGCTDDKGKRHKLNEFYVSQDGCNKCRCIQGGGACTRRLCGRNIVNSQNRFEEMFDDDNKDKSESNSTCNCPKTRMMVCGMNGQVGWDSSHFVNFVCILILRCII